MTEPVISFIDQLEETRTPTRREQEGSQGIVSRLYFPEDGVLVIENVPDSFAKDISTKYISVPDTTDFAIMFLPIEGLFAEVLREPGIMETLRSKYKIALTGPTTLSALLNSLQMGFRTLLVQERSSEVWNILAGVKSEFATFCNHLSKVQTQLKTASSSLESLQSTRTRAMERKLRDVELIDSKESKEILELADKEELPNLD